MVGAIHSKDNYTVGEVAKICDVNPKTLRYYDQIGLVVPSIKNSNTGYRYYTRDDIFIVSIVRKLQQLEFSLKEIKYLITCADMQHYEDSIKGQLLQLQNKIAEAQKACLTGEHLLEKIVLHNNIIKEKVEKQAQPGLNENMLDIKLEEIPQRTVLYTVREEAAYRNSEFSVDRRLELYNLANKYKLTVLGCITLTYHTDSVMEQFFKTNCLLEVALPIQQQNGVEHEFMKTIPAHKAITVLHCGDYHNIIDTHAKTLHWMDAHNYKLNGNVSEEYILSPEDFKLAGVSFITKIIFPVI